jgi:copper(I)-binding protein
MRRFNLLSFIMPACLGLASCGTPAKLAVTDASIRMPLTDDAPGVAYFTIKGGAKPDRLLQISSPVAGRAEMHESKTEGGMMKMLPLTNGVDVPAGGTVSFEAKGKHVMLFGMKPKAKATSQIALTFTFASGTKLTTQAKVAEAKSEGHAH